MFPAQKLDSSPLHNIGSLEHAVSFNLLVGIIIFAAKLSIDLSLSPTFYQLSRPHLFDEVDFQSEFPLNYNETMWLRKRALEHEKSKFGMFTPIHPITAGTALIQIVCFPRVRAIRPGDGSPRSAKAGRWEREISKAVIAMAYGNAAFLLRRKPRSLAEAIEMERERELARRPFRPASELYPKYGPSTEPPGPQLTDLLGPSGPRRRRGSSVSVDSDNLFLDIAANRTLAMRFWHDMRRLKRQIRRGRRKLARVPTLLRIAIVLAVAAYFFMRDLERNKERARMVFEVARDVTGRLVEQWKADLGWVVPNDGTAEGLVEVIGGGEAEFVRELVTVVPTPDPTPGVGEWVTARLRGS